MNTQAKISSYQQSIPFNDFLKTIYIKINKKLNYISSLLLKENIDLTNYHNRKNNFNLYYLQEKVDYIVINNDIIYNKSSLKRLTYMLIEDIYNVLGVLQLGIYKTEDGSKLFSIYEKIKINLLEIEEDKLIQKIIKIKKLLNTLKE